MRGAFSTMFLLVFSLALVARAETPPEGFEDAAVFEKVMGGEIHAQEALATKKEFRTIFRAYFPKIVATQYADLVVSHARYPEMFDEVKAAKTTKVNPGRTEFDYWAHIVYKFGIFNYDVYPEGRHTLVLPTTAYAEARVLHEVLNYKDQLNKVLETTRLIPWEGGILVHDDIYFMLQKESSQSTMIKNQLKKQFLRYLEKFREVLTGSAY